MIKRLIEISAEPAHLALEQGHLLVIGKDSDRHHLPMRRRIPLEDLGVLAVDHDEVTYTHRLLGAVAQAGAVVVVCGQDHAPAGLLVPFSSHAEQVWRVDEQVKAGKVIRKQLWSQIIQAKIEAQAANLADAQQAAGLRGMAGRVRSGDPDNIEAQAARRYWAALFKGLPGERFRRTPGQGEPPNNLLDYGYAILRAGMARALVSSGLFPAIGLKHAARGNALCLADDLIEPLRPMVDARVRRLAFEGRQELDQSVKGILLGVLHATCSDGGRSGPLMVMLSRYSSSLADSLASGSPALRIPVEEFGMVDSEGADDGQT
ncbi:MAG: type II CRISPR-associated endonuclease Cas1 [Leptolyngbya sp. PLA3]|nr:MAG: type II CRISPR-associated endonuclease Cas1 [Cyanobacteria bacterium CYA]MCE7968654.1 type II CRISPR-associated endonuclease Cas1 [Leptolyngbya sp. PL-A3]